MDELILWTNASCSKSNAAEEILAGRGTTRRYLVDPPSRVELEDLLVKLGTDDPRVITRPGVLPDATRDELLDELSTNPESIERPIAIRGDRAVVARPPERINELL